MTTELISQAVEMALSLDDAKRALRIELDDNDQDLLIESYVRGIAAYAEDEMSRTILNAGYRLTLDRFPRSIKLERPPLVSVESVKFFDVDGAQQTLNPADYLIDRSSNAGWIVPAPGKRWPDTACRICAVEVNYTCGYGATPDQLPPQVKLFLQMKLVEQFDPTSLGEGVAVQASFVDQLLRSLKIYSF